MTRMKFCGLTRPCDIEAVNGIKPEYAGFVFAGASRRRVLPEAASLLKGMLLPEIAAVGVFVDERPENVAELLNNGVIDMAQLHGNEDDAYIGRLRRISRKPVIKAFRVDAVFDASSAERSCADYILLDSGAGTGTVFPWERIKHIRRPYFLAGGLSPANVAEAVSFLHPFAVDVSSGIETDGLKDKMKMAAFCAAVRTGAEA